MTTMRAKLQVGFVQIHEQRLNAEGRWDPEAAPTKTMETLQMNAVAAPKYDPTGLDEDNTFAKFSPGAQLSINIANPALWGQFKVGDRFYVDFTPAQFERPRMTTLAPHQQRVVDERAELADRLARLHDFLRTPAFSALVVAERLRLRNQAHFMTGYLDVLVERIAAFSAPADPAGSYKETR